MLKKVDLTIQGQTVALKRSEDADSRYFVYLGGFRTCEVLGGNNQWTVTSLTGRLQLQGTQPTRKEAIRAYFEAFPEEVTRRFNEEEVTHA